MHGDIVLKIALIGALGITAQWFAWRFNLPAIVLMALAGIIAGPALGVLDPVHDFGPYLGPIISIAVALILFEGGLDLNFAELRGGGRAFWRLVLPGAPIAWSLGALAAYYAAGLSWPTAILFGGILVVTGPTVIIPLLRQARLAPRPAAVLKWEGIVNDPIGALLAILVYEYLRLSMEGAGLLATGAWVVVAALASAALGIGAASAIIWAFQRGRVPEYLKAPVLLCAVLLTFALSNLIEDEMGLVAVTAMGVRIANSRIASLTELRRFKENVTVLLVSAVFVILTATLNLEILQALEWRYVIFILLVLFAIRPITALVSLLGSSLTWRERALVGWIAPRGIVAVAVSGFFAQRLTELGYPDGAELVPLSFMVVFVTVVVHGFTLAPLAQLLGLGAKGAPGVLIVGASRWALNFGTVLKELEVPVEISDRRWHRLRPMRLADIPTYYGEILSEVTEHHVDFNQYAYLVAATDNDDYNTLVCTDLGPELGRQSVFQVGRHKPDEEDPHRVSFTLGGRTLLTSGATYEELAERTAAGWQFQKTKLTDKFSLEDLIAQGPEEAETILVKRANGELAFATVAGRPRASAGDWVVRFVPPQENLNSA